ncbi:MAG TPA: hypothetical protein VL068_05790, partial [Microthrixaceae bacterium]|nr:hypothetical protein [Microthrixaceae bacterium]
HHPREFLLQQQLLVAPEAEDIKDAAEVVPIAMLVLDVPRVLLERARIGGALNERGSNQSPLGDPVALDLLRTITWVTALNGALLADRLTTGLPTTGLILGSEMTRALLIGWGAEPDLVDSAREFADVNLKCPKGSGK